jgi:hypothetical protein
MFQTQKSNSKNLMFKKYLKTSSLHPPSQKTKNTIRYLKQSHYAIFYYG